MRTQRSGWWAAAVVLLAAGGCDQKNDAGRKGVSLSAEPAKSAGAAPGDESAKSARCPAKGGEPAKLGSAIGIIYGFLLGDAALYYASWDMYGNAGRIGRIPKNGEGNTTLDSLGLQPRGLALDASTVYYTEGIRLNEVPKTGGDPGTLDARFSSQDIAVHGDHVYGVPADYGPYDRVVRISKKGGESKELADAKRPQSKHGPFGYSRIVVDETGIYVTDSSGNRLLRFALKGGKPRTLAAHQDKPYDLAVDSENAYFTLALAGDLLRVPKAGGTVTKIASGLASKTRFAKDAESIYTTFAAAGEDDPTLLSRLALDGGQRTVLAKVPDMQTVEAVATDRDCVYWAQRETKSDKVTFFALAKKR